MQISQRGLKKKISALLSAGEVDTVLTALAQYPPEKLLNPLFSGICSASEKTKWNAVSAMGATVARLAEQDMEAARIVMRRFMWSLNDESGGIGWGTPEAMAECLARHEGLAREYTHILVAFMREDGFYLELPSLQRGLMWAMIRLGRVRPELLIKWQAPRYLLPYLDSEDAVVRGQAAYALALLNTETITPRLAELCQDATSFSLYRDNTLTSVTVGQLAREALERFNIMPD
ncbi:DVU0298 family protein [Thiovibrio sp. JS02]